MGISEYLAEKEKYENRLKSLSSMNKEIEESSNYFIVTENCGSQTKYFISNNRGIIKFCSININKRGK